MGEIVRLKRCYRCREEKPANSQCFHSDRERKDGLKGECRECRNLRRRKPAGTQAQGRSLR